MDALATLRGRQPLDDGIRVGDNEGAGLLFLLAVLAIIAIAAGRGRR